MRSSGPHSLLGRQLRWRIQGVQPARAQILYNINFSRQAQRELVPPTRLELSPTGNPGSATELCYCLPEAGDIVTLPMKSVSLVVTYSSMLFPKLFHSPALPRAPSIAYHLSVDWHHSKRCVY